ncbi:hypothetical protein COO60DRAFT_477111 [Scenedesmus sp. NREL 46B-D3]|nr:hypothetical protein COO60DRAFT_477111 [Scenedesmus sp. NREL 46B-D3]
MMTMMMMMAGGRVQTQPSKAAYIRCAGAIDQRTWLHCFLQHCQDRRHTMSSRRRNAVAVELVPGLCKQSSKGSLPKGMTHTHIMCLHGCHAGHSKPLQQLPTHLHQGRPCTRGCPPAALILKPGDLIVSTTETAISRLLFPLQLYPIIDTGPSPSGLTKTLCYGASPGTSTSTQMFWAGPSAASNADTMHQSTTIPMPCHLGPSV